MISDLQRRLSYQFADLRLLKLALTHPSAAFEAHKPLEDNQRLEFLGDSVLQLTITEELFRRYSDAKEGLLSKLRTRLVQTTTLARVARCLELGAVLAMGRGEQLNGGRKRDNILADAMEALIGAIYLDKGLEAAQSFILQHWHSELLAVDASPVEMNPKGQLQELLQNIKTVAPIYQILDSKGPEHLRTFVAEVSWCGEKLATGIGHSKKEAQANAAKNALASESLQSLLNNSRKK